MAELKDVLHNRALELVSFLPTVVIDDVLLNLQRNDRAHRWDHVLGVVLEAEKIIAANPELDRYKRVIYVAALMHDTMCHKGRDNHNVQGAIHACATISTYVPSLFNAVEMDLLYWAIVEHRASWKLARSSHVSDAVASADRGCPDLYRFLKRAVLYRVSKLPDNYVISVETINVICIDSLDHIHDKYGPNGYAWDTIPQYGQELYDKEIQAIKESLSGDPAEVLNEMKDRFSMWTDDLYQYA
jgi:hypothetical protein